MFTTIKRSVRLFRASSTVHKVALEQLFAAQDLIHALRALEGAAALKALVELSPSVLLGGGAAALVRVGAKTVSAAALTGRYVADSFGEATTAITVAVVVVAQEHMLLCGFENGEGFVLLPVATTLLGERAPKEVVAEVSERAARAWRLALEAMGDMPTAAKPATPNVPATPKAARRAN